MGDPRANAPNDLLVLLQVCSQTRNLLRQKQNTGNPLNFGDTYVDVDANEDTYLINVPSFGTPLVVMTRDEGNPNHIVRLVPFYLPQNLYYSWGLPNNAGAFIINWDGSNNTAERCSFYWKDNQAYVQFNPIPYLPCQYQIRFIQNANQVNNMALTQSPVEDADSDLIEIRSAKSMLSNAEWMAGDSAEGRTYNSNKRKELLVTLRDDQMEAQRQFDAAVLTTTGPRIHQRWDATTI